MVACQRSVVFAAIALLFDEVAGTPFLANPVCGCFRGSSADTCKAACLEDSASTPGGGEGFCENCCTTDVQERLCPSLANPVCGCFGGNSADECNSACLVDSSSTPGGGEAFCGSCCAADVQERVCRTQPVPTTATPSLTNPVCGCFGGNSADECSSACLEDSASTPGGGSEFCGSCCAADVQDRLCPSLANPVCGCFGGNSADECSSACLEDSASTPGGGEEFCGSCCAADVQDRLCPSLANPVCGCFGGNSADECSSACLEDSASTPGGGQEFCGSCCAADVQERLCPAFAFEIGV